MARVIFILLILGGTFGVAVTIGTTAVGRTQVGAGGGAGVISCPSTSDTTLSPSASPGTTCQPTVSGGAGHPYAAAVVSLATRMANALYVNPACGTQRGGNCNATWYTSAFPRAVVQYGQNWCQAHGGCADWANGSYQCVSFVRGVYSQIYPMELTNDAFGLWATYQHQAGWQEIPAKAVDEVALRGLPQPGDVMVFHDIGVGHVAIVLAVQAPTSTRAGWVRFANANSSSAFDRMPLLPDLTVDTSEWASSGGQYVVWGYLRPRENASANLVRLSQLDPGQYASPGEWGAWAYSACSTAAMTEVLNAYGLHLRIHDVLTVEAGLGEITPAGGLQEDVGIARTLAHFGLTTYWREHLTLAQVIGFAQLGEPVIVSWPPPLYAGGHLLVVTGGSLTKGTITLADSSLWNHRQLTIAAFMVWWAGFGAVAVPATGTLLIPAI